MADTRKLQSPNGAFFGSTSPTAAGFLRGGVYAIITAAIGAAVHYLTETDAGDLAIYAPIAIVLLNTLGGVIDKQSTQG